MLLIDEKIVPDWIVGGTEHRPRRCCSVIESIHDPVFDRRSDAVFAESIAEGFGVVATISCEAPHVAGVTPSDLRANPRVVFL